MSGKNRWVEEANKWESVKIDNILRNIGDNSA